MERILNAIFLVALWGFVALLVLPVVEASGAVTVLSGPPASGALAASALTGIDHVAASGTDVTVTSRNGRTFELDLGFSSLLGSITAPTGSGMADIIKYTAIGVVLVKLFALARRFAMVIGLRPALS